ncbi:MAG: lactonase family protein [Planctomycetales bacterium]|nr:lactonase family protein [Planctomycetales bacterium]
MFRSLLLIAIAMMTTQYGRAAADDIPADAKLRMYIGTYTSGDDEGIYVSELDLATGQLAEPKLAAAAVNPSFLAIHPSEKMLYAVGEVDVMDGKKTGGVSGFSIDDHTGELTLINQQSSGGGGPCHLVVDATGTNVLVANYGGGSVACLPINKDGELSEATTFIQHEGSSVNPTRQEGPHAHSINCDPTNHFALVADLGLDKVFVYRFNPRAHTLVPNDPPSVSVPAGGGPRHFAFHPNGRFGYTNNEITLTVTAFEWDDRHGTLTPIQTITTLPEGEPDDPGNSTAEVRVHPNGRFLYVSNRGHDTIAIFSIDEATGRLTPIGHESTRGAIPRNFNIDPTGRYLIAANQDSGNVVAFKIDASTGQLTPTGSEIKAPRPVCIRFLTGK